MLYSRKLNPCIESFLRDFFNARFYDLPTKRLENRSSNYHQLENNRKMKGIILCLISVVLLSTSESLPLYRRTFQVPSLMEIVARKMGIIDFFSNFVRGIKAVFGPNSRYQTPPIISSTTIIPRRITEMRTVPAQRKTFFGSNALRLIDPPDLTENLDDYGAPIGPALGVPPPLNTTTLPPFAVSALPEKFEFSPAAMYRIIDPRKATLVPESLLLVEGFSR